MLKSPSKTNFIIEKLTQEITSGKYLPGTKIPSLRQLGQTYGVSTMVIHRAAIELERQGLLLRGPRSGLFIADSSPRHELCGFVTSIKVGLMENYYESFIKVCSESDKIAMTVSERSSDIAAMVKKNPAQLFIDTGCKNLPYSEIMRLTQGVDVTFCNRFEFPHETPQSAVLSDWIYITEQTLRHFIAQGHRKILFVSHDSTMREYKRLEMTEAARRVGLTFETPEFQYCCWKDFQDNPERVVKIFRNDPPTAVFARGDYPLLEFTRRVAMFFPELPPLERIGAFNSNWSNQLNHEFSSWQWNWEEFWRLVFKHERGIEYYRPQLKFIPIKHNAFD